MKKDLYVLGKNQPIYYLSERKETCNMKRIPPVAVPLSDKRLLSVDEFQAYCGLGRNSSLKLAAKAKCRICQGRRLLIDRIKFDEWCAEHAE